jgi:hypothetical protein
LRLTFTKLVEVSVLSINNQTLRIKFKFKTMKTKHLFVFLSLGIISVTSLIIYSCQKESNLREHSMNNSGMSNNDLQLEKKIIDFRNQMDYQRENPNLKSGGNPWNVDDAIYYLEALANYTYGSACYSREGFSTDSSFISVPLTNGKIPAANMPGLYDQIIDSLSAHNDRITAQNKQLIMADISRTGISGVAATFKISSGFGTSNGMGIGNDYPWYWGCELGRCDNTGLGVGKDAADKIMQLANIYNGVPSGNSYYDYVSTGISEGCEYMYNDECALFEDFQEYTLVPACLSTTDINFYKNGLIYVGNLLKPSGTVVISYFLEDYTAYALCGEDYHDCWHMVHHAEITYGIWHYNSNPPEEL